MSGNQLFILSFVLKAWERKLRRQEVVDDLMQLFVMFSFCNDRRRWARARKRAFCGDPIKFGFDSRTKELGKKPRKTELWTETVGSRMEVFLIWLLDYCWNEAIKLKMSYDEVLSSLNCRHELLCQSILWIDLFMSLQGAFPYWIKGLASEAQNQQLTSVCHFRIVRYSWFSQQIFTRAPWSSECVAGWPTKPTIRTASLLLL